MGYNTMKFIDENEQYYIEEFAKYWWEWYDYIPNDEDFEKEFKYWMNDYKNIQIYFRYKKVQDLAFKVFERIIELKENN